MHELGIVFHIIKEIEEVGQENNLTCVSSVTLQVGEVSGVLHDYLQDCWQWACNRSTLMQGAELIIEQIPAVTHCDNCGKEYPTVTYGKICPYCNSDRTYLLTGNESLIKEIEAK
jgi:hydrogenase nickel incorporation protein HypA/HybF